MKRILLFTAAVFVFSSLSFAYTVDINEATEKATGFFLSKQGTAHTKASFEGTRISVTPVYPIGIQSTARLSGDVSNDKAPAFYIFNRNDKDGFVIISAESSTIEVLAYSLDNTFDINNIDNGPSAFLNVYAQQIDSIRSGGITASGPALPQYTRHELKTASWNQDGKFFNNKYAPKYGNKYCCSGCVATSMAIVMKYHQWPSRGEGSHSYVSDSLKLSLSMDFSELELDWSKMPDSASAIKTQEQSDMISKLQKACGISVDMDYGIDGSSAVQLKAVHALKHYFHYSYCQNIYREDVVSSSWAQRIMNEIDCKRPVIVSGYSDGGVHSFIIDGYDEYGIFHYNLGWGGYNNGYYTDGNISKYNYTLDNAIIGIKARTDKENFPCSDLIFSDFTVNPEGNLINQGLFSFEMKNLTNTSTEPFAGRLAVVLCDSGRVIKDTAAVNTYMETEDYALKSAYSYISFSIYCQLSKAIAIDPTDRLWLISSTDKGKSWQFVYMISDEISSYKAGGHGKDMPYYSPVMFDSESGDMTIDSSDLPLDKGKSFTVNLNNFYNYGSSSLFNGKLGIAVIDSVTNNITAVVSKESDISLQPYYGYSKISRKCTLPTDVTLHSYDYLALVTKADGTNRYARVADREFQDIGIKLRQTGIKINEDDSCRAVTTYDGCRYKIHLDEAHLEYACKKDSVVIPEHIQYEGAQYPVTAVNEYAFHMNDVVKYIELPHSLTDISDQAFGQAVNLQKLVLKKGVRKIGANIISDNRLNEFIIPEGLEYIGNAAFYGDFLKKVIIPSSIKSFSPYILADNLEELYILADDLPTLAKSQVTPIMPVGCILYVPAASIDKYKADNYWKQAKDIKPIIPLSSVVLNKRQLSMAVNCSDNLQTQLSPVDAHLPHVEWSSSDTAIVKVDTEGNIRSFASGTAVIYVQSMYYPDLKDSCIVTVELDPGIRISMNDVSVSCLDKAECTVNCETKTAITSLRFDIRLPDIVSFSATDSIKLVKDRIQDHTLNYKIIADNTIRFEIGSPSNAVILGDAGPLLSFTVIPEDSVESEGQTELSEIQATTAEGKTYTVTDSKTNVTVYLPSFAVFYYVDSVEYYVDSVQYGATIVPIEAPVREGYTFSGWSKLPETMPAHDVTASGTFTVGVHTVNTNITDVRYFTLDGMETAVSGVGIFVVVTTYEDGHKTMEKKLFR